MHFMRFTSNSIRNFLPNISILMEILVFAFCQTRFIVVFFRTSLRFIETESIQSSFGKKIESIKSTIMFEIM